MATSSLQYKNNFLNFFIFFFFDSESIKPINIAQDINDDPPYDKNGRVIPLVGIKFNVEKILIIVCKIKIIAKPEIDRK